MGVAYYIALERDDAGFDPFVNGKFIARDAEELDVIAKRLGLRPLGDFVQVTTEDLEDTFGEDEDAGELPTQATWYAPDELLRTVNGLTEYLEQNPSALHGSSETLEDLAEYEQVLTQAQAAAVRVRLAIDI